MLRLKNHANIFLVARHSILLNALLYYEIIKHNYLQWKGGLCIVELSKFKFISKQDSCLINEYKMCISDLIDHEDVISMENYIQHVNISCLEHCFSVSFISYKICRRLGLDYKSAARGGLLHDFFLYDWHVTKYEDGLHGFTHPRTALKNACTRFELNEIEKDIIIKHMWPLTLSLPRFKESFVIVLVDKYCSIVEIIGSRLRKIAKPMLTKMN